MKALALPADDARCGWWALLAPPAAARPLTGQLSADAAVLGAGFTGLAIARRLAQERPEWRIVVVDAGRVGGGASGRNSGFVGDIAHRNPDVTDEDAGRLQRVAKAGVEALRNLVREQSIECAWSEVGRIHCAREPHALRNLELLLGLLARSGEVHHALDAAALATALGTEHYRAGVHVPATVLVQPAALARGLGASLPPNVELHEDTPVLAIEPGPPHRLETAGGSLRADRLFVAANGFAPLLGFGRGRVFPLLTFASLTRPLDASEQAGLGTQRQWGIVSEDRMGSSLRRTLDQRLLVRNSVRYRVPPHADSRLLDDVRCRHAASIAARWPALAKVELEYTWSGVLGMTLNQGQLFGRLGTELYASIGYNGTGVAMGTGSGIALAELALGLDSPLVGDARGLRQPAWLPPDPFLGWGVRSYTSLLQRRAGEER